MSTGHCRVRKLKYAHTQHSCAFAQRYLKIQGYILNIWKLLPVGGGEWEREIRGKKGNK